jgi:hypothetical protein
MGIWNETLWVSDEGLRSYFTQRDPGGPSRLDCYRRLLTESRGLERAAEGAVPFVSACGASARRLADLFGFASVWAPARNHDFVGR